MGPERDEQLGAKLTECFADKTKIAIHVGWRMVICLLLDIMNFGGIEAIRQWGEIPPTIGQITVNLILTVAFGLYPLIHLKEYLAFYEYGIIYRKKTYFWSELCSARWRDFTTGGFFRSVMMDTNKKAFNVTYVTNPKRQYNRAYMNH